MSPQSKTTNYIAKVSVGLQVAVVLTASAAAPSKGFAPTEQYTNYTMPVSRIVGGAPLTERVSYMASLNDPAYGEHGTHYCGGALISADWVLTAAHCLFDANEHALSHQIRVGMISQQEHDYTHTSMIERIACHEEYDHPTLQNDICLVKLATPAPADLKTAILNYDVELPLADSPVTYMGWGVQNERDMYGPDLIQSVSVNAVNNSDCEDVYGTGLIGGHNVCTYKLHADSCQGDSGGPLVILGTDGMIENGMVTGITSFGEGCARENFPGVSTRVSFYKDWIEDTMRSNSTENVFGKQIVQTTVRVEYLVKSGADTTIAMTEGRETDAALILEEGAHLHDVFLAIMSDLYPARDAKDRDALEKIRQLAADYGASHRGNALLAEKGTKQ